MVTYCWPFLFAAFSSYRLPVRVSEGSPSVEWGMLTCVFHGNGVASLWLIGAIARSELLLRHTHDVDELSFGRGSGSCLFTQSSVEDS